MKTPEDAQRRVKPKSQVRYTNVRGALAYWRAVAACDVPLGYGEQPPGYEAELAALKSEGLSIETLKAEIQSLHEKDQASYNALQIAIMKGHRDLAQARKVIADGVDPNARSLLGRTAVQMASEGRQDAILKLLWENGADLSVIDWTPLHVAVTWGSHDEVCSFLPDTHMLRPDTRGQTVLDLAVERGDADILGAVLPHMPSGVAQPILDGGLIIAAQFGEVEAVRALLAHGAAIETENEWEETALSAAVSMGRSDVISTLLAAGASVAAVRGFHSYQNDPDDSPNGITNQLMAHGWSPDMLDDQKRHHPRHFTGAKHIPKQNLSPDVFLKTCGARYGRTNPERMDQPAWLEMIRTGKGAYIGRKDFAEGRETTDKMFCFDRYGQSTTRLPDGRWVQIAGEHEDFYDPDFCIYNDVVVHDGAGGCAIYVYPKEVFPPTDFHTATLIGNRILIIGNLGYQSERKAGHTPMFWLDLTDFQITPADANGTAPGWIGNHRAVLEDDKLRISGGNVQTKNDLELLAGIYTLDLKHMQWRMVP